MADTILRTFKAARLSIRQTVSEINAVIADRKPASQHRHEVRRDPAGNDVLEVTLAVLAR